MDFAGSTRAGEDRTRWKGVVAKSAVVPQRSCKIMGYARLKISGNAKIMVNLNKGQ